MPEMASPPLSPTARNRSPVQRPTGSNVQDVGYCPGVTPGRFEQDATDRSFAQRAPFNGTDTCTSPDTVGSPLTESISETHRWPSSRSSQPWRRVAVRSTRHVRSTSLLKKREHQQTVEPARTLQELPARWAIRQNLPSRPLARAIMKTEIRR